MQETKIIDDVKYVTESNARSRVENLVAGSFFWNLHEKLKGDVAARDEERLYFAITKMPGTQRDRGERKLHRKLPSGRQIRIWREGEAQKHNTVDFDKYNPTKPEKNLHTEEKETHEYRLHAQDAVYLAREHNIFIEPIAENLGELKGVSAYPPERRCDECDGPPKGRGHTHAETCSKKRK